MDGNKTFNEGMTQISTLIKFYTSLKHKQRRCTSPLCSHFSQVFECRIWDFLSFTSKSYWRSPTFSPKYL